jgi:N-acetyl-anhydromuramyl-L-alanine amidase AmpD
MTDKTFGVLATGMEDERDENDRLRNPNPQMHTPLYASPDVVPETTEAAPAGVATFVVVNRAVREVVPGCRVVLGNGSATTDGAGKARLDLSGLDDGQHDLSIMPSNVSEDLPGPGFPTDPSKSRIWRPFKGTIEIQGGAVVKAAPAEWIHASGGEFEVQIQPLWMRPTTPSRPRTEKVDLIIIHHTAGRLAGDCNEFLYNPKKGVHYLIAPYGEVYKFVDEDHVASHAGYSYWKGAEGLNGRSIGIELSHMHGAYPEPQLSALMDLLRWIFKAFPGIPVHRVVGHSDVGITEPKDRPPTALGRKSTDPGSMFPWERVEALGLGLLPREGTVASDLYGGFFRQAPQGRLVLGDNDDSHRYGGQIVPGLSGVIKELQTDLANIGYLCEPVDGSYGKITSRAVQMFQQHMFSGSRRRGADPEDRIGADTAGFASGVGASGATPFGYKSRRGPSPTISWTIGGSLRQSKNGLPPPPTRRSTQHEA